MTKNFEREIIQRWQRARERADEEKVRIVAVDGEYRATSTSHPLRSYLLEQTPDGWTCECIANHDYMMPCKHLWSLADVLHLDVLRDMRITWNPEAALVA